jgi:hypothetical protein
LAAPSPPGGGFTEGFWERLDQGNGWPGNFAFGTPLIYNPITNPSNPFSDFSLIFSTPIQGAGAQLQVDHYGTFQVNVSAFDANNEVLPICRECVPGSTSGRSTWRLTTAIGSAARSNTSTHMDVLDRKAHFEREE